MPKISVIIPTWNRADKIGKAVKSALNQTIRDLEILVCDDGSTDNTFEVISSFHDPRVRWIIGERGGRPAIPRNRGLKACQGEWVAFLDSDDEWLPGKIEGQLEIVHKLACKAVCANAFRFLPNKGIDGRLIDYRKNQIHFDDLINTNFVICSSLLLHRSLLKSVGNFPERPELTALEDYALWFRVATQTNIAFIEKPMLIYNDDVQNGIRGIGSGNVWFQRKYVFRDFINWAKMNGIGGDFICKARKARMQALWEFKKNQLITLRETIKRKFQ